MALTASRATPQIKGNLYNFPVAASVKIFAGALIVLDSSGNAKPGVTGTSLRAVGVAISYVDNSDGSAGDVRVDVRSGIFGFKNSANSDEITAAEMGHTVYIVDDQTVAKTSDSGARSPAGAVRMIEDGIVYVDIGMPSSIDGDVLASNNGSDFASAATTRANLGANKVTQGILAANLVGGDAKVYRRTSTVAGTLKKGYSILNGGGLTTGNATLTFKINGVAVTGGVITITQAGSAVGDKDSCTMTAANTVAIGDEISVTVGGTNDATAAFAEVDWLIET